MFFLGKKELSIIELFKEHLFLVDHTMEALYKLLNAI
ncbi:MAG TPA: TIGR00153 family protein, partial [Kosmotogaceae bacterium]|nr:TIGR00153 family protein [Kosmotogaceae bacterium]